MSDPLASGSRLGPYQLLGTLGRGGMGAVYRARDLRLGRIVALKVVGEGLAGQDAAERQLIVEARATATLSHPNVVTLYDVGADEGRVWAALEYVEGQTLAERLSAGRLPYGEALRIARAVAHGLAAAHAAGIVHRDLKPTNVLLGADGRPRILDFGIARALRSFDVDERAAPLTIAAQTSDDSLELVGTPRYMAPEQWDGQDGAPADVWALGILLHILFTGAHPLPKQLDPPTLAALVATDAPLPMSDEIAGVPEPVQGLVRRCLSKSPHARPSAAEVAAMLDRGEPSSSQRLPTGRGPFPGLAAFDEDGALDFAGRADATDACAARLGAQGLVVVTGPSGAGKSSLVAAGLVPRLRGLGPLRVVRLRAGAHPFLALSHALVEGVIEPEADITRDDRASRATTPSLEPAEALAERLRKDPESLAELVLPVARARGERVLFFVDQLEEMLAPGLDRDELRALLEALASAASAPGPVHVVITVRDDHLGQVPFGELAGRFLAATVQLSPPDARALEQMITRPMTRAGYRFEDGTAPERLASSLAGLAHALPLLQVALGRLWEARDRAARTIPRAATDALTDPLRILSEVADAQVDALEPAMLETVRQLFVRLVTPERSRARVPRSELVAALGPTVEALITRFEEAGILAITDAGEVELAHEAIVDRWDRLSSWLDRTDVVSAHAKEIEQRARRWEREGRSDEALLTGAALRASELLLGDRTDRLTPIARELLDRSRAARARQRRLRLVLRAALTGSLLVALVAAVIAAWALSERETLANDARQRAEGDRASLLAVSAAERLAGGDLLGARALARASLESGDDLGTRSLVDQLRESPLRFRVPLGDVLYNAVREPGSPVAWIASTSGAVLRLDTRTAELAALRGHSDQVTAVTRTASGALVSIDWSGGVRRWEGDRSTEIARTTGDAPVQLVAAGDVVVIGTITGALVRLDLDEGTTSALTSTRFAGRAFDAHGDLVWAGRSDGHVVAVRPLEDRVTIDVEIGGRIRALQVSPDGARVATSSMDGRLAVHEVATGRELARWPVGEECRRLLWIDDRRLLAACGGTLHHVDVADRAWASHEVNGSLLTDLALGDGDVVVTSILGAAVYDLAGLARPIAQPVPRGIATTSGVSVEHGLAFVGTPGWLHVLRLDDARIVRAMELGGADAMREIIVTPDAVLVSRGSQVSRFSLPGMQRTHVFSSASGQIEALALSGDRLVSGGRDGQVTEWSVATGLARRVVELGGLVRDVVLLDDGTWIAGATDALVRASADGTIERRPVQGTLLCLSRDAEGRLLVGTSEGRVLRFADLHAEPEVLVEIDARVYAVRAAADGRVAFASADRLVRILSPDGSLRNLVGHRAEANSVAFSSDGEWLVSAGDDSTLRAWDARTGAPRWATTGLASGAELAPAPPGTWDRSAGEVRCVHREGRLAISVGSAPRASRDVGAVDRVVATPWGCALLSASEVEVHPAAGEPRAIEGRATAIATDGDALLVALEDVVIEVAADGATRPLGTIGARATALLRTDGLVWWGDERGVVHALDSDVALEPTSSTAAVSHLSAGPAGTLVAGRTDGTLDLWSPARREHLRSARVHGAVADAALAGSILHVLSELGDRARVDLTSTSGGWCQSLRELWDVSALTWRDGVLAAAEPPRDHPCAR